MIYWDIDVPRSQAPHKVQGHNDRRASQWNDTGDFSEDADAIVASVPQQLTKR
jgi:hypothetical protein